MKVSRNIHEFYTQNDRDVTKLIHKHFKNIITRFSIEDIKNEIYERLIIKKYIENYRPFTIYVDTDKNTWEIQKAEAKFSTYIFTFIKNYIVAYYGNKKRYESWLSLDEYNDSNFSKESSKKSKLVPLNQEFEPTLSSDFKLEIESILKKLQERTAHKGTLVCDSELELDITKFVDSFGESGCSESVVFFELYKDDSSKEIDFNEFKETLDKLIEDRVLKKENNSLGEDILTLDEPNRRSLYNLFRYYVNGYKDKEISEKFEMTVAGVGALKRNLRKELKSLTRF